MVNPQLLDYIKRQLGLNKPREVIRENLIRIGWKQADVEEALNQTVPLPIQQNPTNEQLTQQGQLNNELPTDKPNTEPGPRPKVIKVISNLFLGLALFSMPGAFAGSAMVLASNKALIPIPGQLEFEIFKAMPYVGLISVPGIMAVPLLLLAALKIKSGSFSAWKLSLFILILVIIVNITTGFLARLLVDPIYQATTNY